MNRRLQQFLAAENISQSQFADTIGVARASVSHILAGRNKPGFDFIESMARNFPDLNLEWLISGNGKMFKSMSGQKPAQAHTTSPTELISNELLFDNDEGTIAIEGSNIFNGSDLHKTRMSSDKERQPVSESIQNQKQAVRETATAKVLPNSQIPLADNAQITNNQRSITRIIVFYDDNTYQELK